MEITPKISDFERRIYLDKISKSIRDLNSMTYTPLFVQQMVSLSTLLSSFDQSIDNSIRAIDENAQDPTYFIAALLRHKKYSRGIMGI